VGFILGRKLPATVPTRLGQFLYWVGVPISIVAFLRKSDLSGQIWIAPIIAHTAILLGAFFAWLGIKGKAYLTNSVPQLPTQGSYILAAMVGNTGYLGYPIILTVVDHQYFGWALFYDLLGTTLGIYIFGVALAARLSRSDHNHGYVARAILINPALWSCGLGLLFRRVAIAPLAEFCLDKFAWIVVALSLILIGMRLVKLNSWYNLGWASISVVIKMLLVPLIISSILPLLGITGSPAQVIVLQMAMPPAFSTLIIAEAFDLNRDLTVTALAIGTVVLLLTLPVWLKLF
jgi:predicted permease